MKTLFKSILSTLAVTITLLMLISPAFAATNTASDAGGGGVSLTTSGAVEVTSTPLQLVKQVWIGGTCYASSPADAGCNGSATSINVPAGTAVDFLIYVDNTIPFQASDVRISDAIDATATGFTYVGASMSWNTNGTATGTAIGTIFTDAAVTGLADAAGGDIASALDTGGPATEDQIDIGLAANAVLDIPGSFIFGMRFQATKN